MSSAVRASPPVVGRYLASAGEMALLQIEEQFHLYDTCTRTGNQHGTIVVLLYNNVTWIVPAFSFFYFRVGASMCDIGGHPASIYLSMSLSLYLLSGFSHLLFVFNVPFSVSLGFVFGDVAPASLVRLHPPSRRCVWQAGDVGLLQDLLKDLEDPETLKEVEALMKVRCVHYKGVLLQYADIGGTTKKKKK